MGGGQLSQRTQRRDSETGFISVSSHPPVQVGMLRGVLGPSPWGGGGSDGGGGGGVGADWRSQRADVL